MKKELKSTMFKMAEINVVYQPKVEYQSRPQVLNSDLAYNVLMGVWNFDTIWYREEMLAMFLNMQKRVIGFSKIASGGIDHVSVDVRIIYAIALKVGATALIIAHNHPTGNTRPSDADLELTKKVKEAGKLLGIQLVDHLIVTGKDYLSLGNEGLM